MNKFFKWLHEKDRSKKIRLKSRKKIQFSQLKILWEESAGTRLPEAPNTDQAWAKLQTAIKLAESKQTPVRSPVSWSRLFQPKFAYVMAVALILIVSSLFFHFRSDSKAYSTRYKEQLSISLSDDSRVRLNSGSQLWSSKNFNKQSRGVSLKGEAYFEVSSGEQPFIIMTDIGKIKVVGTQFNVKSRDKRLEVAVNQGVVELSSRIDGQDSTIILREGQYSTCHKGEFPGEPQRIPFEQYPGWIHGKMIVNQTELKYVCQEIERRFDVSIHIEAKEIENIKVSGLFEATDLENLLSAICILVQKEYRYEHDKISIY